MTRKEAVCDVVCVGQAVLDCITRGREKEAYKPNVYRAEGIRLSTGGDAVNESFVLAGLGRKVRLVCGLGQDLAGNVILAEATRRGVDTSFVSVRENLATPVANLIVAQDGSRVSVNSLATMLDGYIPDKSALPGARIVSLASLFRAPLDQPDQVIALIKAAHESGAAVCADTKLPTFRTMRLEDIREALPFVDYIFPNENEAAFYTGKTTYPEMAEAFHSFGIKNVIIKTGVKGCYMMSGTEAFSLPASDTHVVDSTGAGDNFVAGFYDAYLAGASFRECGEAGIRQAAKSLGHAGATEL